MDEQMRGFVMPHWEESSAVRPGNQGAAAGPLPAPWRSV